MTIEINVAAAAALQPTIYIDSARWIKLIKHTGDKNVQVLKSRRSEYQFSHGIKLHVVI